MGSIQHIKAKYGEGYIIEAKTKPELSEEAENYVTRNFPNARIKEKLPTLLVFQVRAHRRKLAGLFEVMEEGKTKYGVIKDYTIGQTTLDQIFINFVNKQDSEAMLEKGPSRYDMKSIMSRKSGLQVEPSEQPLKSETSRAKMDAFERQTSNEENVIHGQDISPDDRDVEGGSPKPVVDSLSPAGGVFFYLYPIKIFT